MVDDTPEDMGPTPEPNRTKRAGPTIDLEATEVSHEIRDAGDDDRPAPPFDGPASAISSAIIAAVSGAAAAGLLIGAVWLAGESSSPPAPQVDSATLDRLASRVADIETKTAAAPTATPSSAPDPMIAANVTTLEKSVVSLRGELASLHAQSDKLAADITDVKATPRLPASTPDLSAIDARLTQIEGTIGGQNAEIAKDGAKPADDIPLRRVVVASMLDISVRQGDSFAAALAAAKSLAENPDTLKPLDGFAVSGVPSAAALSRELLTLVPRLSTPAKESETTGSGLADRLEAGAARLVRIERTDATGNDRAAIVARVTAAALRNDSAEARRELNTLAPADRAAAQTWLDKSNARDAALAASRQFADDAMSTLAKPGP